MTARVDAQAASEWTIDVTVTCTEAECEALMEELLAVADGRGFGAVVAAHRDDALAARLEAAETALRRIRGLAVDHSEGRLPSHLAAPTMVAQANGYFAAGRGEHGWPKATTSETNPNTANPVGDVRVRRSEEHG